ncbi:MAG: Uma2 family endonuclease [Symplocastrum torsivum CPER-KK1]|uniref:Uma2 family endonuclease n=1 Tax=Symplocastrum torsivum CPER-KK1 TaxID=450513 RepID=A0A951UBB3_9CYAN|nr:Uma2 family endonuclease [Symplocastrum torsivum CPER-KK1]
MRIGAIREKALGDSGRTFAATTQRDGRGSRLGWLIDPDERSVLVYPLGQQPELLREPKDVLPVPDLLAGWQVTVGDLFGWLRLGGDSFT